MPTSPEQKKLGWVSITEVLDFIQEPGLVAWKVKVGAKEAKRTSTIALKIGSRIHELIEIDWKKGAYKLGKNDPVEVVNCMKAWEMFKADYQPLILDMEIELKDSERLVLGHRDIRMKVGDAIVSVDFKTSARISPKHWLQVNEYNGIADDSDCSGILRLDKNLGIYEWKVKGGFDTELNSVFNSMLHIYRFYNQPMAGEKGEDE